ncbi:MAG: AAA-like domain-containing protein [Eubacterium sp.]|nr:AAA-like domain-containing protein [Eubacterium sp.]
MRKRFNVNGDCKPGIHYMAKIDEKLKQIKYMVDQGQYFTINRARQYGKTTILHGLERILEKEYIVVSLDFQMFSTEDFKTEKGFVETFTAELLHSDGLCNWILPDVLIRLQEMADQAASGSRLSGLFRCLSKWCGDSPKKIVLLIDEVDNAVEHQVFLDFLSQLRGYYLIREKKPTFHSVVLAGVCDIKNLKNRFVSEHKMNSPWNIAADFDVDLSLSQESIEGMLKEYEKDCHTGMNVQEMSASIYDYTAGYPYLVSRICKLIDEKVAMADGCFHPQAWTKEGFLTAIRMLLSEENPLFESLDNKLVDYPGLKQMLQELLLQGRLIEYIPGDMGIRMAAMFGFVKIRNQNVSVANRIFETRLYNGFLAEQSRNLWAAPFAASEKSQFVEQGRLNMELVIQKFVDYYTDIFSKSDEKFLEEYGRCLFLLFLRPIINGTGNYYIEARTRTNRRTDLIVDCYGQQYIIELKIWRGLEYHKRGEEQLVDYLDSYHADRGYLISFNFNQNKKPGVTKVQVKDKWIIEAVV